MLTFGFPFARSTACSLFILATTAVSPECPCGKGVTKCVGLCSWLVNCQPATVWVQDLERTQGEGGRGVVSARRRSAQSAPAANGQRRACRGTSDCLCPVVGGTLTDRHMTKTS
eukprot:137794-Chlamydomonas_euryale.AAC.3